MEQVGQSSRSGRVLWVWVTLFATATTLLMSAERTYGLPLALDEANGASSRPSLSAEGRYVAFVSSASNLVASDANALPDVFVKDRETGVVALASGGANTVGANGQSASPSISASGGHVAFSSDASNLVTSDTNAARDLFVRDRAAGATTRVSVDSAGIPGNGASDGPSISADGRYVAFSSDASNLVTGDTNSARDLFVRDRATGTTTRVSVDSAGTQGNGASDGPSISADGRYVAYSSDAPNLVTGDTNAARDVFLRDRTSATTVRVSIEGVSRQGDGRSHEAAISPDGRYISFTSEAGNLGPFDPNGTVADVFLRDRSLSRTLIVSREANDRSSHPSVSSDGGVSFESLASNLVSDDFNSVSDVFEWRDGYGTLRVSANFDSTIPLEGNGQSISASRAADGAVAFVSEASNLVAVDANLVPDVFVYSLVAAPLSLGRTAGPVGERGDVTRESDPEEEDKEPYRRPRPPPRPLPDFEPEPEPPERPDPADDPDPQGEYLYRAGSRSNVNFTPREPNDTSNYPLNGLSTWNTLEAACAPNPLTGNRPTKAQGLDRDSLSAAFEILVQFDPKMPGHYFVQASTSGLHLEWARSRPDAEFNPHRLTTRTQATIVARDIPCPNPV